MNKRGQGGLSINTIIVAIIAVVVLLLIITFFTGGMSTVYSRIRDVFTGGTAGYDVDLAKTNCQSYCERAKLMDKSQQPTSTYCTKTFALEDDKGDINQVYCNEPQINTPCAGLNECDRT